MPGRASSTAWTPTGWPSNKATKLPLVYYSDRAAALLQPLGSQQFRPLVSGDPDRRMIPPNQRVGLAGHRAPYLASRPPNPLSCLRARYRQWACEHHAFPAEARHPPCRPLPERRDRPDPLQGRPIALASVSYRSTDNRLERVATAERPDRLGRNRFGCITPHENGE